jgi:hypothetical protein
MPSPLRVGAASGNTRVRKAAQTIVKAAAHGLGRMGRCGVSATTLPALFSTDEPCVILTHSGDVSSQLLAALLGHLPLRLLDVDETLELDW